MNVLQMEINNLARHIQHMESDSGTFFDKCVEILSIAHCKNSNEVALMLVMAGIEMSKGNN